jgi:hypothetical protein
MMPSSIIPRMRWRKESVAQAWGDVDTPHRGDLDARGDGDERHRVVRGVARLVDGDELQVTLGSLGELDLEGAVLARDGLLVLDADRGAGFGGARHGDGLTRDDGAVGRGELELRRGRVDREAPLVHELTLGGLELGRVVGLRVLGPVVGAGGDGTDRSLLVGHLLDGDAVLAVLELARFPAQPVGGALDVGDLRAVVTQDQVLDGAVLGRGDLDDQRRKLLSVDQLAIVRAAELEIARRARGASSQHERGP